MGCQQDHRASEQWKAHKRLTSEHQKDQTQKRVLNSCPLVTSIVHDCSASCPRAGYRNPRAPGAAQKASSLPCSIPARTVLLGE